MKILIVTTRVPYPPFKGDKLKIYNIVKHLARKNSVKVLCLANGKSEMESLDGVRALGAEIEAIPHSAMRSLLTAGSGIFTGRPIQVSLFKNHRLGKRLEQVASKDSYDVIYFHFIRSAQYVKYVEGNSALKVLDFTDAVSLYLSRFVEAERNPFVRWAVRNEKKRIAAYENIAENFDTCFICSPLDRDYLLNKGIKADFQILPNGVDTDAFKKSSDNFDKDRIIFTGNMPYFPNEDAVVHFAKVVLPLILKKIPSAKFYIVGGSPTRKIRNLSSENIIVTGFVKDIAAEYVKSAVAIAPMRFGAGTLNKVIEPVVLGIPVVATSIAVRGLPDVAQKAIHVADEPERFADAVVDVVQNRSDRKSCVTLNEIREEFSWEKIVEDFERYLRVRTGFENSTADNTYSR